MTQKMRRRCIGGTKESREKACGHKFVMQERKGEDLLLLSSYVLRCAYIGTKEVGGGSIEAFPQIEDAPGSS